MRKERLLLQRRERFSYGDLSSVKDALVEFFDGPDVRPGDLDVHLWTSRDLFSGEQHYVLEIDMTMWEESGDE